MSPLLQDLVPEFDHPYGNLFPLYLARICHVPTCVCCPFSCPSTSVRKAWSVLQTWPPQWPYWTCSCMPLSLYWESQTRHPLLGLMSAGQRDRIPPFALPAAFLTQPGMRSAFAAWAHCWLLGNLLSTWIPRYWVWFFGLVFFAKLLIKQSAPSLLHCKGSFHPRCRPLHQPLLSFLRLFSARFSSPSQSPWTAALLSSVFTAMPNLVLSTRLLVVCSIPSFKPWIRC